MAVNHARMLSAAVKRCRRPGRAALRTCDRKAVGKGFDPGDTMWHNVVMTWTVGRLNAIIGFVFVALVLFYFPAIHERLLPPTKEGDVLLIANAGAYGRAMSSSYNLREPALEVIV